MDRGTAIHAVTFLSFALALNLWLSFRLIFVVKRLRLGVERTSGTEVGASIRDFCARRLEDDRNVRLSEYTDYAIVLVFLSATCRKCRDKLPELEIVLSSLANAGVVLWILTNESDRKVERFLQSTVLVRSALAVDQSTYKYLNPLGASPYYLFINSERVLQAEGLVGDMNWAEFADQVSGSKCDDEQ